MSLSKKYYNAIAKMMKSGRGKVSARRLADFMAKDNPRFSRTRFLRASGVLKARKKKR